MAFQALKCGGCRKPQPRRGCLHRQLAYGRGRPATVCDIELTDLMTALMLQAGRRRTEFEYGGAMQDRDSFYHRAIRAKLGEAMKAQQRCLAMARIARDQQSRVVQREMAAEWLRLAAMSESERMAGSIPIERLDASNDE
jgi:hypothetical protein